MKNSFVNLLFCFLVVVLVKSCIAIEYQENDCEDRSETDVENFIGDQVGLSGSEMHSRLILADKLSERSFTKTWASSISLDQYNSISFGDSIVKENKHRFSYPQGEASGGYRNRPIPDKEPFMTWETRAREVMQWTYDYALQLSGQIEGFGDLFPVKPTLDQGCEQRFHATHAELKLLTRLMIQGQAPEGMSVTMSVSRHMCTYCVPIVSHLARNGRRRVAVVAPRKKTRGTSNAIEQPEYILFEPDGSYTKFLRSGTNAGDLYSCKKFTITGAVPAGLDTFQPPNPPAARMITNLREFNDTATVLRQFDDLDPDQLEKLRDFFKSAFCTDEVEGPENACVTFIGGDLPKSVECPSPQTVTGVHGSFGPLSLDNPLFVLKSIGAFCDVTTTVDQMGSGGVSDFELMCPDDYQLTGFHGSFGTLVNMIGIVCRNVFTGAQWKSELIGSDAGGTPMEKECETGAAGREIKLWLGDAIDGFGLCCR